MKKTITILLALLGATMVPGLRASEMSQDEKNAELLRAVKVGDNIGVDRILDLKADANRTVTITYTGGIVVTRAPWYSGPKPRPSILSYAIECANYNGAISLLRHKADPSTRDIRSFGESNAIAEAISMNSKISPVLLLHPNVDKDIMEFVLQILSKESGPTKRLTATCTLLSHILKPVKETIHDTLYKYTTLNPSLITLVTDYAVKNFKSPPGFAPTHDELNETQQAFDLAEEIYFDAPAKKPKINKEEIEQQIAAAFAATDFATAQKLIDQLNGVQFVDGCIKPA